MSIRWKDPLSTMFPSLWSSSRSVSNVATKPNLSPPTQDAFHQQKQSRQQQQHLHRDIEAAAEQTLTPVFVQPTLSQQIPLSPGTGNSITGSRTYQHDGDPFHRRSGTTNHHVNIDGSADTSTSNSISNLPQQQLQQQQVSFSAILPYSDAIPNSNSRSGNFPVSDVLLPVVESNSGPMPRPTTVLRGGGGGSTKVLIPEPKLLHPYVYLFSSFEYFSKRLMMSILTAQRFICSFLAFQFFYRSLLRIPLHIRFALNGFVCNILVSSFSYH